MLSPAYAKACQTRMPMLRSDTVIAGIDEVGRGCLAGPVYAAAVILSEEGNVDGLRDSKKLSAAQRERLAISIRRHAVAFAIGTASVAEIDKINILQATFLAMQRAVSALPVRPALCRVDGSQRPHLAAPVEMVVGGDSIDPRIMAASIIAKVERDHEMVRLDSLIPGYGFSRNKGYGTPEHLFALKVHGPSTAHRMSFAPCERASCAVSG